MKWKDICFIVLIISNSFFVGAFIGDHNKIHSVTSSNYDGSNSSCSGLDLINTSLCLVGDAREWFHYNITNLPRQMTLEQLKSEGGVCHHMADYYKDEMQDRGFYATTVTVIMNDTSSHEFTVASKQDNYCILDQTSSVKCWHG